MADLVYIAKSPFKKIKQKARTLDMTAYCYFLIAEATKYIPIFSGALRQNVTVQTVAGSATIIYSTPYAIYQYGFDPQTGEKFRSYRHAESNGLPISLSEAVSAKVKRKIGTEYTALYAEAKDSGVMKDIYPNGARWFERALNDPQVRKDAFDVLMNSNKLTA